VLHAFSKKDDIRFQNASTEGAPGNFFGHGFFRGYGKIIILVAGSAVGIVDASVNFIDLLRSRFLVKRIDILRDNTCHLATSFQSGKKEMCVCGGNARKILEEFPVEIIEEGGIFLKGSELEYFFRL